MNQANGHPHRLMLFGAGLISLASKLGVSGIRILVNHHFTPVHRKPDNLQLLAWSSVPFKVAIQRHPSGKLSIIIHRPAVKYDLKPPKLHNIRACFYNLLSAAIVGHWGDHSMLAPEQIRFLMRLSGLKLSNGNVICDRLTRLKTCLLSQAGQSSRKVQKLCRKLYQIFLSPDPDKKAEIMLGLIKGESLCNPDHYTPLILTKRDYLNELLNKLPIAAQGRIQHEPGFNRLFQLQDRDYVTVSQTYRWYPLTSQEVINLIDAIIFYLT